MQVMDGHELFCSHDCNLLKKHSRIARNTLHVHCDQVVANRLFTCCNPHEDTHNKMKEQLTSCVLQRALEGCERTNSGLIDYETY